LIRVLFQTPKKTAKGMAAVLGPRGTLFNPGIKNKKESGGRYRESLALV
jgi:hypothetical protein